MNHFLVYGIHPAISQAETIAVLGVRPTLIGRLALVDDGGMDWNGERVQDRLAGTVKLGDIVAELPMKHLAAKRLAELIVSRPRASRILFGLTVITDRPAEAMAYQHLSIELKRVLQDAGKSVRWVTGDDRGLSPAAISKLDLTQEGYDFVIGIRDGIATIGLTTHVQNADAWSARDMGRPFRDTKTGMLPPKLARIMVNLALGKETKHNLSTPLSLLGETHRLLDPFCGAGTILMEAGVLMEKKFLAGLLSVQGSDCSAKQVKGAKQNLDWLKEQSIISSETRQRLSVMMEDARTVDRRHPPKSITAIVTEGDMGSPLRGGETFATLERQAAIVSALWRESLQAFAKIQPQGGKIVGIWPQYQTSRGKAVVNITDDLAAAGYCLSSVPLPYRRADQSIERNIVVIERR